MKYPDLLDAVQKRAGLDRDGAEAATTATVRALAERITSEETHDLSRGQPSSMVSAPAVTMP